MTDLPRICPPFDASTHHAIDRWMEKVDASGNAYLEQTVEPIPPEEIAAAEAAKRRAERDAAMPEALNILSRHRNQRDYGITTTLTEEQAAAWAAYLQGLRDYPETGEFPSAPT
ncbi:hypothetical protein SAMN02982917_0570 [Azospirillum oryzae]|uniref:Phage tail assembly chaperone-like domain-containing protein n=1 Tax=Azospirillum oryzae TaxID=286727 RepID=A0A1X7HSX2_9PROT|nr:phage tail assembly chaperone [Azospirillum oryzae]SMF92348.1 hypothetical protein SAMN02982917_0570 [Azospirillum oryzae]